MVEQGTHKPLVGGSIPPSGTTSIVYHVYLLRGSSGRHYIGQTADLAARWNGPPPASSRPAADDVFAFEVTADEAAI